MRRLTYALLALAVLLSLATFQARTVQAEALPCSAATGHVTLVVEHQDGTSLQRCVGINGSSTTASTVLSSSGVEYDAPNGELCQVDNDPATGSYPVPCLLGGHPYWAIWVRQADGSWKYAQYGISNSQLLLSSGDTLGLRLELGMDQPVLPSIICPQPASSTPTASGGGSGGSAASSGQASSVAQHAAPSTSTHATATATPTGATLGIRSVATSHSPSDAGGISWVLLFSCMAGGGLLGRIVVQVIRR